MVIYEDKIGRCLKMSKTTVLSSNPTEFRESRFMEVYRRQPDNNCGMLVSMWLTRLNIDESSYRLAQQNSEERIFVTSLWIVVGRLLEIELRNLRVGSIVCMTSAPKEEFVIDSVQNNHLLRLSGRDRGAHPLWLEHKK